jgi:hypothetical protein
VLADGVLVGRIFKANAAPISSPWMSTLAFGHHEDRTPTHGYAQTRDGRIRQKLAARVSDLSIGDQRYVPCVPGGTFLPQGDFAFGLPREG